METKQEVIIVRDVKEGKYPKVYDTAKRSYCFHTAQLVEKMKPTGVYNVTYYIKEVTPPSGDSFKAKFITAVEVRNDPDQDHNTAPQQTSYAQESSVTPNAPAMLVKPVETKRNWTDSEIEAFKKKDMLMVKMNCANNSTQLAIALAAWITAKGEISNPDAFLAAIEKERVEWFNKIYKEITT